MEDFKILKFIDKLKGIFINIGVDYEAMRKILQIKLIMDKRRVPTMMNNSKKKKEHEYEDKNNFVGSLWLYALYGLIIIPFILGKKNYTFQMSFVFGIMMFIVMTSLISDFSSVLLDVRDINIIYSKPVSSKTLNFAKTLHVLIYMSMLTFAVAAPALAVSLFRQGVLFFLIFLLELILLDLLIVVLTALLYMLILRFFDGEKLKDIINYVQIILTITLTVGYQLIGRLFQFSDVNLSVAFNPKWWQYFIIPLWFASPFDLILKGYKAKYNIIFSVLAVVVPIVSIIIYTKLVPAFERNLQKLNNNSSKSKDNKKQFENLLSNIVCRSSQERVFFKFTSDMIRNERDFKLKVYPSLGFSMIFPFIFLLNNLRDDGLRNIAHSNSYLNLYFCALMMPTVIIMMKYSSKYKGAWIYNVMPLEKTSFIYKGALKAVIIKLILPLYIAESVIFTLIFGVRIIPDLVLIFLNIMLFSVTCFKLTKKALPFSMPIDEANQSGGFIVMLLMLLLGVLAIIHYFSTKFTYGVYLYICLAFVMNILMWKFGIGDSSVVTD